MKVMHLESGRHLYGGPRQVAYLLEGLRRRGVDNVLLCPPGQPLADSVNDCRVVTLPMRGDLDCGLISRIRRQIAAHDPDLIHVHSRRGAELFGGWASRLEARPAVLTRRVDSHEFAAWARCKYRPYRRVVAISRAVEAQLRRTGLESDRLTRIPSAVDTTRFRPDAAARGRLLAAFDLPQPAALLGIVAQLIPRKGHAVLLDCLPPLLARHPDLRLLCFGRGPAESSLRRAIAARGLDGVVRLAGHRDDIAELMPGLDLLIHPASREGLGVAVLEAMSCGVPVVASAVGGLTDVIESGREGLLFEPGRRDNLTAAVGDLLSDPQRRQALGRAGRRRVERDHSIETMTDRYLDVYRAVCTSP